MMNTATLIKKVFGDVPSYKKNNAGQTKEPEWDKQKELEEVISRLDKLVMKGNG